MTEETAAATLSETAKAGTIPQIIELSDNETIKDFFSEEEYLAEQELAIRDFREQVNILKGQLSGNHEVHSSKQILAEQYIEQYIDEIVPLVFVPLDLDKEEIVRLINFTFAHASLSSNQRLLDHVSELLTGKKYEIESLIEFGDENLAYPLIKNVMFYSKPEQKAKMEDLLYEEYYYLQAGLAGENSESTISFLNNIRGNFDSEAKKKSFDDLLCEYSSAIASLVTVDDLKKSREMLTLLRNLSLEADQKYFSEYDYETILVDKLDVLKKGFEEDGYFYGDLSDLLVGDVLIEDEANSIINFLETQIENPNPEIAIKAINLLNRTIITWQNKSENVANHSTEILQKYESVIMNFILEDKNLVHEASFVRMCSEEVLEQYLESLNVKLGEETNVYGRIKLLEKINYCVALRHKGLEQLTENINVLKDIFFKPLIFMELEQGNVSVLEDSVSLIALFSDNETAKKVLPILEQQLKFNPDEYFGALGVDKDKFLNAWRRGSGDVFENFENNINAIDELVKERGVEIIKVLSNMFGIKNFGRYPAEILIRQFDSLKDATTPQGVIIYPGFDHNRAFSSDEDREIMSNMNDQLKDKYITRIGEVGSIYELLKLLMHINNRYGPISYGLFGAHGNPEYMQLGMKEVPQELNIENLKDSRAKRFRDYFVEDATIILESCSTGAKEGIAEEMSKALNLKVIAPKFISGGILKFEAHLAEDKPPAFDVEFDLSERNEYVKGELKKL